MANIFGSLSASIAADTNELTVGVEFVADVDGRINGIRYYRDNGTDQSGAKTALLYSMAGTVLASKTFSGETSSGWQYQAFDTPVSITAGTHYVAAVFVATGGNTYCFISHGLNSETVNGHLTAVANASALNGNGVFVYTGGASFPNGSYNETNYLVDVDFDVTGPTIDVQPKHVIAKVGETASFSVSATASGGSLSYQWQSWVSGAWADISGATSSSYTTGTLAAGDSEAYRCNVTDDNGTTATADASLTVALPQKYWRTRQGIAQATRPTPGFGLSGGRPFEGAQGEAKFTLVNEEFFGASSGAAAALEATPSCGVTATASLSTGIALGASVSCATTATAALTTSALVASSVACLSSILSASLTTQIKVASALAGVVTTGADLSTQIKAQTSVAAQSTLTAALTTGVALASAPADTVTLAAGITTAIQLASAPAALSVLSGSLTTAIQLAAAPAAVCAITADLTAGANGAIEATPSVVATLTGALTTAIRVAATPTCTATATASLTTGIALTAAIVAGDPYFANVVLSVDASARTNGSTPSDIDLKGKTPTYRGNAQVKTDQFRFGSSSLYFDGTNDRVSFADSADWSMGTGDATWEAWVRPEGSFSASQRFFLGQAASTGAFYSALMRRNASDLYHSGVSNGSVNYEGVTTALASDTWVHLALTRSGANLYSSINGVTTLISSSLSGVSIMDPAAAMCLGGYADADHATNWKGWIDQVRITKGVARYTGNFTAPVEIYPRNGVVATAALTTGLALAAAPAALTTLTGALTTAIRPAAAAAAVVTITADLSVGGGIMLAATPAALATLTGALTTAIRPVSAAAAQATATGTLTTDIRLASSGVSTASISASLTTGSSLESAPAAQVAATGALTTAIRLAAGGACTTGVTATLTSVVQSYDPARSIAYVLADTNACAVPVQEGVTVAADTNAVAVLQDNLTSNVDRTDAIAVPADFDEVTP